MSIEITNVIPTSSQNISATLIKNDLIMGESPNSLVEVSHLPNPTRYLCMDA